MLDGVVFLMTPGTFIFGSTKSAPVSAHGLNALLSLALIHADAALATAVVHELAASHEQSLVMTSDRADFSYMCASLQALDVSMIQSVVIL